MRGFESLSGLIIMKEKNQEFHIGLKAFIRKNNALLILRESDRYKSGGKWELPGGRIKNTEVNLPLEKVLTRELSEELGDAVKVKIGKVLFVWKRLTHPDKKVFLVGFDCSYKAGDIKLSDEHTDFAWIKVKDTKNYRFVDGYKEVIVNYFKK